MPDLLSLQPGVLYLPPQTTSDSRSGAVNGERSDQGNVTIDGVDDNDQVNGFAFTGVLRETQDSIEEFRVTTGDANADAGRSSGAQISMVTKSGTNKFHGAAYEYNRPTITVANDWFNKQAELDSGLPNIPGKLIRNIFGGAPRRTHPQGQTLLLRQLRRQRGMAENMQVNRRSLRPQAYQAGEHQSIQTTTGTRQRYFGAPNLPTLDAGCQVCNTAAYPNPPGPNPNALAYFNSMPAANGSTRAMAITTGSFSFSSPNPIRLNTTIGRIDFVPSDKHRIFVRGNLQKDTTARTREQFPGPGPVARHRRQ